MNMDFRRPVGSTVLRAFVLSGLLLVGGALLVPIDGATSAAYAADSIRIPSNVCAWYDMDWAELNSAEQQAWSVLGWTKALWDSQNGQAPSEDKDWTDLNPGEQAAAQSVGFTSATWGSCP
jgi:hypothetical protein